MDRNTDPSESVSEATASLLAEVEAADAPAVLAVVGSSDASCANLWGTFTQRWLSTS